MSLTVSKMALATLLASGGHRGVDAVQANPIRKVVNMLQAMQEKVKTEGEKEEAPPDLLKFEMLKNWKIAKTILMFLAFLAN